MSHTCGYNPPPMRWALVIGLMGIGLLSCSSDGVRRACGDDDDCAVGFTCDAESGSCLCASNAACAVGEFCNGRTCQIRVGCDTTLDCPAHTFCDRASGNCLESDLCTEDVQCPFGEICDRVRFQCVPGCRDVGDCRMGDVCRCPAGQSCSVGTCEQGPCDDDSFCRFGERCLEQPDGEKWCEKDERGPYCEGCQTLPGVPSRCPGDDPNFCLLDRKVEHRTTYCGVDCAQGQPCPWGYECRNILVLTQAQCQTDADCTGKGPACSTDADCPGARCDQAAGRCAGTCSYNEDSKSGYCTCSADSECPQDTCSVTDFRCRITRRPCTPEGGECDRAIYCVNLGDRAACLIGKNCVPGEGLRCEDVRASSAAE